MDEAVHEAGVLSWSNIKARAALGEPYAVEKVKHRMFDLTDDMTRSRAAQHRAQAEEDAAFALLSLHDTNRRRVLAAQEVRTMPMFKTFDSQEPEQHMKDFHDLWGRQEVALGELLQVVSRTLFLEAHIEFRWPWIERRLEDHEQALVARIRLDRLGHRLPETPSLAENQADIR